MYGEEEGLNCHSGPHLVNSWKVLRFICVHAVMQEIELELWEKSSFLVEA